MQCQSESEGLKARRADGVAPFQRPGSLRPRKCWCFILTPKSGKSWGLSSKESVFLLYLGLQLIGWSPRSLGRAICFTQSTNSHANLIQKHPYRHTRDSIWPNIWSPYGPVQLTHINHHICPIVNRSQKQYCRTRPIKSVFPPVGWNRKENRQNMTGVPLPYVYDSSPSLDFFEGKLSSIFTSLFLIGK